MNVSQYEDKNGTLVARYQCENKEVSFYQKKDGTYESQSYLKIYNLNTTIYEKVSKEQIEQKMSEVRHTLTLFPKYRIIMDFVGESKENSKLDGEENGGVELE